MSVCSRVEGILAAHRLILTTQNPPAFHTFTPYVRLLNHAIAPRHPHPNAPRSAGQLSNTMRLEARNLSAFQFTALLRGFARQ